MPAILIHRNKETDSLETRWYGEAQREYVCGDFEFVSVKWKLIARNIKSSLDINDQNLAIRIEE